MTGIIDWAASRARMVVAFVVLSLVIGAAAYVGLPKEGEPDIDIPILAVTVPFPGISAEDAERLLVRPMEAEFQDLDGLTTITSTANEGFAGVFLEFEFGWNKSSTIADVRDAMGRAETQFPDGADSWSIDEINFSEFPILTVSLSGNAPERTLIRLGNEMQDALEALPPVLEAGLTGTREEMIEVIIDPLALEAYDVTAADLINAVVNNNQLIAAGELTSETGAISVTIPSSFDSTQDIYNLAITVNGDRVVTLGELAEIRLTYQDREGTARFNGEPTIALQVVKRQGFNIIETVELVRRTIDEVRATWPEELRASVEVATSLDESVQVAGMVRQLEGSVLTAIALVMIVVLASLGTRSALLVGFAIPTSFLLCFILLGVMGIPVSNIVMFGLILAVGMLVDGAIVVVEYADKRLQDGARPMQAYTDAAKRMFWPIVSSTATTLCAFLPMLFWPGVPGEFMGMLPVTLIFVLSASLIVALIYLPVLGGVAARGSRMIETGSAALKALLPWYPLRLVLAGAVGYGLFLAALQTINPGVLLPPPGPEASAFSAMLPGALMFVLLSMLMSMVMGSIALPPRQQPVQAGYKRTPFGWFIAMMTGNPVMPLVAVAAVGVFVVTVFSYFAENNNGVEFFVETEPERAVVYVRARGNLSIEEKDILVRQVEEVVLRTEGVRDVFAFAGDGGLSAGPGDTGPVDSVGQVQIDFQPWGEREDGNLILDRLAAELDRIPGIYTEISEQAQGPVQGKPVTLRLSGDNWEELQQAAQTARDFYETLPGLIQIDDTLPLPGVDWEINVDTAAAGRYGADVATVGAMVQLVTRGILLDTIRVDSSDEEIDIRVRFPEEARMLSTLDTLRVRTRDGLVPLANFVTYTSAPQLAGITRIDQSRIFDVRADVEPGLVALAWEQPIPEAEQVEGGPTTQRRELALARVVPQEAVDAGAEPDLSIPQTRGFPVSLFLEPTVDHYDIALWEEARGLDDIRAILDDPDRELVAAPVTANERIERISDWLTAETPLPASVSWEWAGDQEEQAESQAFLTSAFGAALGLMFIILLAQFNSFYNAVLVLLAVVLSTTGVLIGMLVMDQTFSIIMTGTGIVALAGIVVNNNIVLIDTYQEYARYMPRLEAIVRTAETRIRPVLLTTITTMAGLAPMMYGISLDFGAGGYTVDSPTALWWKQLATAVVFGLGIATVLTLIFTPSLLALRVWFWTILGWAARGIGRLGARRMSARAQDWALQRQARRAQNPTIFWDEQPEPVAVAEELRPDEEIALGERLADGPPPEGAEELAEPERLDPDAPPLRAAE
jgi:multidrug efflux pump